MSADIPRVIALARSVSEVLKGHKQGIVLLALFTLITQLLEEEIESQPNRPTPASVLALLDDLVDVGRDIAAASSSAESVRH